MEQQSGSFSLFFRDFLIGGISGSIANIFAQPFQLLNNIIIGIENQNQGRNQSNSIKTKYESVASLMKQIYSKNGFFGFFQLNLISILGFAKVQAFNFSLYDAYKRFFNNPIEGQGSKVWSYFLSGGLAGFTTIALTYQLDYVQTLLMRDKIHSQRTGQREFTGFFDAYRKILTTEGIIGLHRGFGISAVGVIVFRTFFFGFYDTFKKYLPSSVMNNILMNFLVAWGVSTFSGVASFPVDQVRRVMMQYSLEGIIINPIQAAALIIKQKGFLSLISGAGAFQVYRVGAPATICGYNYIQRKLYQNQNLNIF